jgi:hypothetical protein
MVVVSTLNKYNNQLNVEILLVRGNMEYDITFLKLALMEYFAINLTLFLMNLTHW